MSKGVFTVIDSLVGRQERVLIANEILRRRLAVLSSKAVNTPEGTTFYKPTIADIAVTHNLFIRFHHKPHVAFGHEYIKTKCKNFSNLSNNVKSSITFNLKDNNGHFLNDMVVNVKIGKLGSPTSSTLYRLCDLPGVRLFKKVSLVADHVVLDEYTTEDVLMFGASRLSKDKRPAWERLVGQQTTKTGVYRNADLNVNQLITITDGPQTFRPEQPALDLWIPLIFDFNLDVQRSLFNTLIRSQQIQIIIELADLDDIVQAQGPGGDIINFPLGSVPLSDIDLYAKNIYVEGAVNDALVAAAPMTLLRVRKSHTKELDKNTDSILLNNLKYPIEIMNFGFRPLKNVDFQGDNARASFDDWHKFSVVSRSEFPIPAVIVEPAVDPIMKLVVRTATYADCTPTVDKVGITIHGNELYPPTKEAFFGDYHTFAIPGLVSNELCGLYTLSFCHYPNSFDPSGHFNNTTARELYLNYESGVIDKNNRATLYVSAQCINVLMYDRKSIKLKYT